MPKMNEYVGACANYRALTAGSAAFSASRPQKFHSPERDALLKARRALLYVVVKNDVTSYIANVCLLL